MITGGIMRRGEILYLAKCSKSGCKWVKVHEELPIGSYWTNDPDIVEKCKADIVTTRCPKCSGEDEDIHL